ncbi:radical SAM protein [candidate division KSB1 bacterium]|nr:radical SAM protein [candidate division KSB1 bacterium]
MNVLFIFPTASNKFTFIDFHHGIAQLSACLKKAGHDTELYQTSHFHRHEIDKVVDRFKPDILAYSFTSDHAQLARHYAHYLTKHKIFSIAGGVHPTMAPDDVVDYFDCLCIGEGEHALLDIVNGAHLDKIGNLVRKVEGRVVKNAMVPLIENLDDLPFPDRQLFNYQNALNQDHRADFMVGRGCPYRCTYCINNQLINIAPGRYVRLRSVPNVLAEIKEVLTNYEGIESICFQDDTFALKMSWLEEFCQRYKNEIGLPFVCNLRADRADEKLASLLADAGCQEVRIGVEQGNEELRRSVMQRKMSNEQIVQSFQILHRAGIKTFAYNMIGIPGETEETIKETIALNRQIKPDKMHVSIFRPYPGTELHNQCIREGYIRNVTIESYFQPVSTIDLPNLSKKKIEYWYRLFRPAVYFPRFLPLFKIFARFKIGKNKTVYDILFGFAYWMFRFAQKNIPQKMKDPLFRLLKA